MPNGENPEELANSALHCAEMNYVGSFMFNKAAERLRGFGRAGLPAIESLIFRDVISDCPIDDNAQHARFPGLGDLLTEYFDVIRESGDFSRGAGFMSALHGGVLIEAVRVATMVFQYRVPEAVNSVLRRSENSTHPGVREIVRWSLSRQASEDDAARSDGLYKTSGSRVSIAEEAIMTSQATVREGASA